LLQSFSYERSDPGIIFDDENPHFPSSLSATASSATLRKTTAHAPLLPQGCRP